jgi:deoxyribonucleoside regulator
MRNGIARSLGMKKSTPIQDNQLKLACMQRFYCLHESQEQIAKALKIGQPAVSRLLNRARREGDIKIQVVPPRDKSMDYDLMRKYQLQGAIVSWSGDESLATRTVAFTAAEYLEEIIRDNMRIGVSCGATLLECALQFNPPRHEGIEFVQLGVESAPEKIAESPLAIAAIFAAKFDPIARCYGVQPFFPRNRDEKDEDEKREEIRELRERIEGLNVLVLGMGALDPQLKKRSSFNSILLKAYGDEGLEEAMKRIKKELQHRKNNLKGEINNIVFDGDGNAKLECLPKLQDRTIEILNLEMLRGYASRNDVKVIGVACGRHKVESIDAALRGRLFNILITDALTARDLLDEKGGGGDVS